MYVSIIYYNMEWLILGIHNIISIMEKDPDLLDLLKYCPYEILGQFEVKEYRKGTIICRQGLVYDYFYIIVDGHADIYIMAENGKKYSQAVYKKGNYIGELEIFDRKPYSCFVEALTDMKLLQLKREYFLKWIELDRNINNYIMHTLCSQFYNLSVKAGEDTLYSLKQRVCNYLISCSNEAKKGLGGIEINVQKEQLSERFAVTQRSINRILQYLKGKSIIEVKNKSILIKDLNALRNEEKTYRDGQL